MKKILVVFLLSAKFVNAFNSGLNTELSYLYVTFIAVVLLIIGIDKGIKLVRKKLKEKEDIFNEHTPANPIE